MRNRRQFLQSVLGGTCVSQVSAQSPAQSSAGVIGPCVQRVQEAEATLLWIDSSPGEAELQIASPGGTVRRHLTSVRELSSEQTGLPGIRYRHAVTLRGLSPATTYEYRVRTGGRELPAPASFQTAGPEPFSFLAFGDSGANSQMQVALAARMRSERAALVAHLGDVAYPEGRWTDFETNHFGVYRELVSRVPFFPCPGNHEYYTPDAAPYFHLHEFPSADGASAHEQGRYYSFDRGDVHFVSLDSNVPLENAARGHSTMLDWLERDLAATRKFWKVVFFHHPPFAWGPNQDDPLSTLARQLIVPIVERHGVQLVLNGHEHSYQRTHPLRNGQRVADGEGTVYVTCGAAGAHLYDVGSSPLLAFGRKEYCYLRADVAGNRLTLRARLANGDSMDELILQPRPRLISAAAFRRSTPPVAPGSVVTLWGRNLALREAVSPGPVPGLTLTASGRPATLLYASPTQVNAVLPYGLTGETTLEAVTPGGTSRLVVEVAAAVPTILSAAHADGSVVTPDAPAAPGEAIALFVAGLGEPGPVLVRAGAQFEPATPTPADVPGVSTVRVTLPETEGPALDLSVRAHGVSSPPITVPVASAR